jgi:hypothetical protein
MGDTLSVFQRAQLIGQRDTNQGVRADAEAAALGEEVSGGKQPITEIGFGDRAKAYDRSALGHACDLASVGVRRVYEAPVLVDFDGVHQ